MTSRRNRSLHSTITALNEGAKLRKMVAYSRYAHRTAALPAAFNESADHVMKYEDTYSASGDRHIGYSCSLSSARGYSTVTTAYIVPRVGVFRQVKGVDERYVVGFDDTDFCLSIRAAGYKTLYNGATILHNHESATHVESKSVDHFGGRLSSVQPMGELFVESDPLYNPLLTPSQDGLHPLIGHRV